MEVLVLANALIHSPDAGVAQAAMQLTSACARSPAVWAPLQGRIADCSKDLTWLLSLSIQLVHRPDVLHWLDTQSYESRWARLNAAKKNFDVFAKETAGAGLLSSLFPSVLHRSHPGAASVRALAAAPAAGARGATRPQRASRRAAERAG